MTRTFQDGDLLLWEAYTAAPRSGEDRGARIVFHCLTDQTRRARVLERDESRTQVEKRLGEIPGSELVELLDAAEPLK